MSVVGLVFDHAVFGWVKSAVLLFMAPEMIREVFWGYRDSHLKLQAFNLTVTQLAP